MAEHPLYPVRRVHLNELSSRVGIWQHAEGSRPNRAFGYCTDDVARALSLDMLHARALGWQAVETNAWISLVFLRDAFDRESGRFHNFRSAEGQWLDKVGSEDSHARAVAALGQAMAEGSDARFVGLAAWLFELALPAAGKLTHLRPIAAALIGCDSARRAGGGEMVAETFRHLATRLAEPFAGLEPGWPWPSDVVTYENGLLPEALIVAGARLGDEALLRTGRRVLDWLVDAQTTEDGHLSLIGNRGWWPRGGEAAQSDQQPIDATMLLVAAHEAIVATGEEHYREVAEMAYGWFLGDNDGRVSLADPGRGGCHDGLGPAGANPNQGAESTLMWLTALEHMRAIRTFAPQTSALWHSAAMVSAANDDR